jgi:hypothetical protein
MKYRNRKCLKVSYLKDDLPGSQDDGDNIITDGSKIDPVEVN